MGAFRDLTGQRFNRLIVDQVSTKKTRHGEYLWLCVCDCGQIARVASTSLTNGNTKSCGCLRDELIAAVNKGRSGQAHAGWKHGLTWAGYQTSKVGGKQVLRHRAVMEEMLGRPLLEQETVHHINGIRSDNRPENLELWSKSHPSGQRVEDKVKWAVELLRLYAPELLGGSHGADADRFD